MTVNDLEKILKTQKEKEFIKDDTPIEIWTSYGVKKLVKVFSWTDKWIDKKITSFRIGTDL